MTGFDSKRQAAQGKLQDDDDTQVYADTLTIVYQSGFADGKRAAERKPLTMKEIIEIAKQTKSAESGGQEGYILPVSFARAIEAAHGIKEGT
jgi:hypothetical protein